MTSLEDSATRKGLLFSPLKRFQREHCQQCTQGCNPSEQRFLNCVLTALLDTINRNNTLNHYKGSHGY